MQLPQRSCDPDVVICAVDPGPGAFCYVWLSACAGGRYVWENLEVGYIQGMCDLLAPLLVVFDDGTTL